MVGLGESRWYVLPNFSAMGMVGHTNLRRFYSCTRTLRLAKFIMSIVISQKFHRQDFGRDTLIVIEMTM